MLEFFRDGGFAMYPTLLFGALLLAVSVRYALTPEKRFLPLLFALGTVTMSSGALGFVTGLRATSQYVEAHDQLADGTRALTSLAGFGESLANIAFALGFLTLAALATSFGGLKIARRATA